MGNKSLIAIVGLVTTLVVGTCTTLNNIKNDNLNKEIININEGDRENKMAQYTTSYTITMRDAYDFFITKDEHYPLSDEFVEKYQQKDGGYIDYAKQLGMVVDKHQHLPNQKWHFFESWLIRSIEDGSLTWDESAKPRIYTYLLCPELLLWIYEAAGVDPVKVHAAMIVGEEARRAGGSLNSWAAKMRQIVLWEDIQKPILEFLNNRGE